MGITNGNYVFNLENIVKYIEASNRDAKEFEITEEYNLDDSKNLEISSKVVRECNGVVVNNMDNIKYDLVKTMMVYLMETDESTISNSLAFNTFKKNKFIEEYD